MPVEGLSRALDHTPGDDLPPGTTLLQGQYTITRFLNSGGFGITYLATDSLDREVVIKECFASALCRRSETRVRARTLGSQEDLRKIIRNFLGEARSLAALTHPNIVGVHQVFEDNDTAYMALDYIRGRDLLEMIDDPNTRLGPDAIVAIARKLIPAIGYIHDRQVLHCDISPDNIFLSQAGEPILIDFGAARRFVAGSLKQYSGLSVVKDGYSPHELYFLGGNSGPWSDLYSFAASLSHLITGEAPIHSQSRLAAVAEERPDPQLALAGRIAGFPPGFLESVDKAMAVMPANRFQSAGEWLSELNNPHGYEGTNVKFLTKALGLAAAERSEKKAPGEGRADAPQTSATAPNPKPPSANTVKGKTMAINLTGLTEISGFIGACIVDSETGFMMASEGGGKLDLEAASAANTEVVRAKLRAIELLGLNDSIEDILITLGKQLHLIRPLEKTPTVFIYVALDKKNANLGLARVQVKKVEQSISM